LAQILFGRGGTADGAMLLAEDLLADDSPLLEPKEHPAAAATASGSGQTTEPSPLSLPAAPLGEEPLPSVGRHPAAADALEDATATSGMAAAEAAPEVLSVTFEKAGSLGIEFERLAAPFMVEKVHDGGLAVGTGLEPGHRLITVCGEAVDSLPWEDLKDLLQKRPCVATFRKEPDREQAGTGALLSGLAGGLSWLGSSAQSVAQQGLDLGGKVSSTGLDIGSKVGTVGLGLGSKVGNVGLDLSSKVGTAGLDISNKMTNSFYSGLLGTMQETFSAADTPSEAASPPAEADKAAESGAQASPPSAVDALAQAAPGGDPPDSGGDKPEALPPVASAVGLQATPPAAATEESAPEVTTAAAAAQAETNTAEASVASHVAVDARGCKGEDDPGGTGEGIAEGWVDVSAEVTLSDPASSPIGVAAANPTAATIAALDSTTLAAIDSASTALPSAAVEAVPEVAAASQSTLTSAVPQSPAAAAAAPSVPDPASAPTSAAGVTQTLSNGAGGDGNAEAEAGRVAALATTMTNGTSAAPPTPLTTEATDATPDATAAGPPATAAGLLDDLDDGWGFAGGEAAVAAGGADSTAMSLAKAPALAAASPAPESEAPGSTALESAAPAVVTTPVSAVAPSATSTAEADGGLHGGGPSAAGDGPPADVAAPAVAGLLDDLDGWGITSEPFAPAVAMIDSTPAAAPASQAAVTPASPVAAAPASPVAAAPASPVTSIEQVSVAEKKLSAPGIEAGVQPAAPPAAPAVEAGPSEEQLRLVARVRELEAALSEAEADRKSVQESSDRLSAQLQVSAAESARLSTELQSAKEKCTSLGASLQEKGDEVNRLEAARKIAMADSDARAQAHEDDTRSAMAAAEKRLREELTSDFEARLTRLARQHEEAMGREKEAWDARRKEEAQALEASLEAARKLREEEGAVAKKELEQLKFAICEKDKQLAEKVDAVSSKEEEVRSLLKQLAAVPVAGGGAGAQAAAAPEEPAKADTSGEESATATTFEVMFALEGPLGLQFRQLSAPYVVQEVHANRVASGLGISAGDELVMVAEESVTEAPWEALVQRLSKRPVVARFRRYPRQQGEQQEGSFISSVGSSLLTTAAAWRPGAGGAAGGGAEASAGAERLQAEVERLGTFLRARDAEIAELRGQLRQREEALRLLEGGDAAAVDTVRLAQEKEALAQQLQQLQLQLGEAQRLGEECRGERDSLNQRCLEEARQKEEFRQQAAALTERCNSLMTQFESLRATCQSLSLDSQQKAALEGQVQELARMNAHWQQAHQSLTSESEALRQKAAEVHQLQAEMAQLRQYEQAYRVLEGRLQEAENRLQTAGTDSSRFEQERLADQMLIRRLQEQIDAVQETGESEAGHLEGELLEQSRECASLRRETEELRKRIEDLLSIQQECQEAASTGRLLRDENISLKQQLATAEQEQTKLNSVVERCLEKMEKDGRERPHLVDKRMVTQMVAAYLEQRDNPRQQQEILARMADLLGFTTAEREQVGLSQRRRTLLEQQEATGLADLTDRFVDFLFEESEGV